MTGPHRDGQVRALPEILKVMREPWLSEDGDYRLQEHVRFASALNEREGKAYTMRFASGGQGTIIEEPLGSERAAVLRKLMDSEYLGGPFVTENEVKELREFLSDRGAKLQLSSTRIPQEVIDITMQACSILPESHFGHEYFTLLELGGWGHGSAKASEHDGERVHLFTFATKGPRRNFAALLLHEIGHAFYSYLSRKHKDLHRAILAEQRRLRAFDDGEGPIEDLLPFAVDYLLGIESRIRECITDAHEFAAEFYLIYVVRGRKMLETIDQLPSDRAGSWRAVYEAFREGFDGVEYE